MNKNYKQKKVFNFITLDMAGPDNKEILLQQFQHSSHWGFKNLFRYI